MALVTDTRRQRDVRRKSDSRWTPPTAASAALDAVIEEARRRARRRRFASGAAATVIAALGAAVGAGLIGQGGSVEQPRREASGHGRPRVSPQLASNSGAALRARTASAGGLLSPRVGWGVNGQDLYLTTDTGRHWRVITPRDIAGDDPIARVTDVAEAGKGGLWLVATTLRASGGRWLSVEVTHDEGAHWRSMPVDACTNCAAGYLSRVDATVGFALAGTGAHGRLYKTRDGGRRWTSIATTDFVGRIIFISPLFGWAVSEPRSWRGLTPVGGGVLYATQDGGKTWTRPNVPRPGRDSELTLAVPRFFGRQGVLPALITGRSASAGQRIGAFVTHDRGRHWGAGRFVAADGRTQPGLPEAIPFAAASLLDWKAARGSTLESTTDGGRHWTAVSAARGSFRLGQLSFTSRLTGWAVLTNNRLGSRLARTVDGGRAWSVLAVP
jgi:photosystem II stability/assembly factor-like uncharacterized protein